MTGDKTALVGSLDAKSYRVDDDGGSLQWMGEEVHACNVANGWFDDSRTFGDDIALLHSEASEMLEAFREGVKDHISWKPPANFEGEIFVEDGKILINGQCKTDNELIKLGFTGKPEGVGSEAADVLIRLLDTCKRYEIDLFDQFRKKLDYNKTRGFKHGNKRL